MELTLLLKSFFGLVSLLAILIFFLIYSPKKKKIVQDKEIVPVVEKPKIDLASLLLVIQNKQSTTLELQNALDMILKYHGTIHPKLGIRAHPEFQAYSEVLLRICRHKNTNKNLILKFNRELERLNPEYKREINDSLTKGLNSRGV